MTTAKEHGAEGQFNHAGLNPATLSTTFSNMATSMTTTRNDLCSMTGENLTKTEKNYSMRRKERENIIVPFRREINSVHRYVYAPKYQPGYDGTEVNVHTAKYKPDHDWKQVKFFNRGSAGFDVERDPFGKVSIILYNILAQREVYHLKVVYII